MIARTVAWSARHSLLVLLVTLVAAVASYFTQRSMSRDALPDLSNPQIVLVAEWMGHPAAEVASEVTEKLTKELDGVPGSSAIRGSSMTGMAYVDVVFDSPSALGAGRKEILRRVAALQPRLQPTVRVQVGPIASSTSWVFQYAILPPEQRTSMAMGESAHAHAERMSLVPHRRFQDEILRPALSAIPGVAEVATVGGASQEVLVETTAEQLRSAGVAFSDLATTLESNLKSLRGSTLRQLEVTPLGVPAVDHDEVGGPRLERVASVRLAPAMETGIADVDGEMEAVGGIVIAERGADVNKVIAQVKQTIERERSRLPPGLRLGTVYDRSELAARVEGTLLRAVAEEVAVVVLVVLLFLLHLRSGLVPLITLPLVVLFTFAAMRITGVPATVMSLGGIAIALGMAVDAELVALEACHRRLEHARGAAPGDFRARIIAAAGSFAPAILTSLVIAALAFVPVFAFSGETGRLLMPLAMTKTFVIFSAAVVTLTVAPALRDRLVRGRILPELENPLTRRLVNVYRPFVHFALARPMFTLVTAGLLALSCLPLLPRLGSEFLPRIHEGDLLFMPTGTPGLTAMNAEQELKRQDRRIAGHPQVAFAFGKIGRADTATDPAPFSMTETMIRLKPRAAWPKIFHPRWYSSWAPEPVKRALRRGWPEETPPTNQELVDLLDRDLLLPGWTNAWTAPVRARLDMMSTGVRTPLGARIVAADPDRLNALGAALQNTLTAIPGTKSAVYESQGGETRLTFVPDAAALARHKVDPELVRSTVALLLSDGQMGRLENFDLQAARAERDRAPTRLAALQKVPSELKRPVSVPLRISLAAPWDPKPLEELLRDATVRGGDGTGQPVPLALLGHPEYERVPSMLRAERGERVGYVYVDLAEGADLGGYVERARQAVEKTVAGHEPLLRPGERIEWTGQYELLTAGERRLRLIAPLVLLSMLGLLFLQFRSWTEALIVLVAVPFALVGSFWTLYLLDYRLSAPVWVGLLSVVGLAMQTGVVMVVYIDEAFHRRVREGRLRSRDDIIDAHAEGTVRRLRPKIMTITTMAAGLLPLLWAQGSGAEIMRRVAAPMIGGLITSAFITLEVIPVLYTIWRSRQLEKARRTGVPLERIVGPAPAWARDRDEEAPASPGPTAA
jgi:Cu(I)/Ag(I) efflux system membrane protein CusA/SilA